MSTSTSLLTHRSIKHQRDEINMQITICPRGTDSDEVAMGEGLGSNLSQVAAG
jgi:hypothetical protein